MNALMVKGRKGRHELINGVYEPMPDLHHDKPCWVSRSVQPVYIFHSGKSRWVISKWIDDGTRCFSFVRDSGGSPDACQGPWICCADDGEWRADANVSCTPAQALNDPFVKLRMSLEGEMRQYGIINHESLRQLWQRLDYNGNDIVSLAEIDKMVVELVAGGVWPVWLNAKPALMRAYKKTILLNGNGDDWVQKSEFHALLLNIFWFCKLWKVFDMIDTGDDRRVDAKEFVRGMAALGLHLSDEDALAEFAKIDQNHGSQVLFVEFCAYIRKRVNPCSNPSFDADIISGEKCGQTLRKHHGNAATQSHVIRKKCFSDFDALEAKVRRTMSDHKELHSLWNWLDCNGNNIVSLAEIDKFVVERFPLLNHKPALMRAYKASIHAQKANDWVDKSEFKTLLANIFYFNKLFWLFEHEDKDHDRRLKLPEFKWCLTVCGCNMSELQIRQEFSRVDRNGGGIILFDEFCKYFSQKMCPEVMTSLVEHD